MPQYGISPWFSRSVLFLSIAVTTLGQGGGTIQETVTDPSGAVVPQATIAARNGATGVETTRATTAAGLYVLSPLPPGEYTLRAAAAGFQTLTQEHIVVDALATLGVDLTLRVGEASQEMTVESRAAALSTEDVTLGQTVQNQVYDALPLAMGNGAPRDPTQFIALAPGVSSVVTLSAGTSYTSFNGAQQSTNGFYLEGIAMTLDAQGDTRPISYGISVEAVDQFQVEVNGEKAQYQGQGFHNYQLKSGTNHFHGAAYEYFRNTDLDARGFFSPFVPLDRQNEFGGNVGGPVKKEKLFFLELHRLLLQHLVRACPHLDSDH
jgi:hypothetical protein